MVNPKWKIVTLGYRNENVDGEEGTHPPIQGCTSTLIEVENRRIVVDPGLDSIQDYATTLFHQTGYNPDEIDTVFLTHFHANHRRSLHLFRKSVWLMSRSEIRWRQKHDETNEEERDVLARIVPAEEHALPGVELVPTPGHTHGSTSLLFETREGMIVAAGDAALTFEHFEDRHVSEHAEDIKEAKRSIDRIAKMADLVIPGHENYFVV